MFRPVSRHRCYWDWICDWGDFGLRYPIRREAYASVHARRWHSLTRVPNWCVTVLAFRRLFFIIVTFFRPPPLNLDGAHVLSAAASTGHIAFWDLNSGGKLLHVIRGAHEGAATAIEWVPGQPILVSSGEDNSIKVGWCDRLLSLCQC